MATTSSTTPFVFPPLKIKKANVKLLNFDRICFQFLVSRNKECTLVGYKMKEEREFKRATELVEPSIDSDSDEKAVTIRGKVLFVQLELTAHEIGMAKGYDPEDAYIRLKPKSEEIRGYSYVIYKLKAATAEGEVEAHPCPPAIPPGGGA